MGGVCTRQLADVVVALCAPNEQNLNGTILMANSFRRKEILDARNGKPDLVLVPSRLESAELESRNRFKEMFKKAGKAFLPPIFETLGRSFWDLQIPYVARFSYDEALAVGGPSTARVIEAEEMTEAYRRLAAHLVLLAPQDSPLRAFDADDLERFVALTAAQTAPGRLWRSVFISYTRQDGERLAKTIRERLAIAAPDIAVWFDQLILTPGSDWHEQIKSAISSVETLLAIITPSAEKSDPLLRELSYARREGVRILPVLTEKLQYDRLPKWLTRYHFFDLNHDWTPFLQQLRSPYRKVRVPFMAPELPKLYVDRDLRETICQKCLSTQRDYDSLVLAGPGGFGKTVLASAVARDETVVGRFEDGILWAPLGAGVEPRQSLMSMYQQQALA